MNGSPQQHHLEVQQSEEATVPGGSHQQQSTSASVAGASGSGNPRNSAGIELSDDEEWSSLVERAVLERTKSDRSTRSDENRRRRTIIVEKKNGTYGFTLQSYGIHYKREQEIEMVTYVDYVEYDGPAFKAGMREGDVIISINGQEMDRADHKTLVNFIKNCDSRMRMVVSFEDCVRKVELHMRYIELQRMLQGRLSELERLCERERSILMGRWKTHSLPARKRTPSTLQSDAGPSSSATLGSSVTASSGCCRPASSTEHLLLYSVYADGRSFLIPRNSACLVAVGPPRSRSDNHHFLSNVSVHESATATPTTSSRHSYHQASSSSNGLLSNNTPSKGKSKASSSHGSNGKLNQQQQQQQSTDNHQHSLYPSARNLCVACISSAGRRSGRNCDRAQGTGDGGSLDAYDLASPCCDPNCVPSRRRREKQRRSRHEQGSQTHQHQVWHHHLQQQQQQQQQQQHAQATHQTQTQREQRDAQQQTQSRDHQHNCSRASGHSLHSIASSDMSAADTVSCTTSLSTDTLYWDPNVQHRPPPCLQYAKPKSWDNLATKAFGGYGFGYGYLDTAKATHSAERPSKAASHHGRAKTPTSSSCSSQQPSQRRTSSTQVYSGSSRHFQPTKSTESLLIATPYPSELDATLSCECLDGPNPRFIAVQLEKHKRQNDSFRSEGHAHSRHRRSSHSDAKQRSSNSLEITRL